MSLLPFPTTRNEPAMNSRRVTMSIDFTSGRKLTISAGRWLQFPFLPLTPVSVVIRSICQQLPLRRPSCSAPLHDGFQPNLDMVPVGSMANVPKNLRHIRLRMLCIGCIEREAFWLEMWIETVEHRSESLDQPCRNWLVTHDRRERIATRVDSFYGLNH